MRILLMSPFMRPGRIIYISMFLFSITSTAAAQQWTTSGTNIYNANSGFVGIGKIPVQKLDVNGGFQVYPSGNGGTTGALKLQIIASPSASVIQANSDNTWANHDIVINAANASAGNVNQMVVHRSGNIGIGSSAPQSKLDINHNVDGHTWNLQVSNEHHDYAGDQAVGMKLKLGDENESTKWAGVLGVSEGIWENYVGLAFYTNGYQEGTLNTEKMRITGNGSVGIGTSSPDAKLTVKGDIHTREVRVDMNGAVGPDYVFENDYDLLPLTELEVYIRQNKHLPEVPSAKEMENNGLNLKEMNLLLLKKVEELTLHIIELEKRVKQIEGK